MSSKELEINSSAPTPRNNVTMNVNHHNKNPFLSKQNAKKLCYHN